MKIQTGTELFVVTENTSFHTMLLEKSKAMEKKDKYITSVDGPYKHESFERSLYLLHWSSKDPNE